MAQGWGFDCLFFRKKGFRTQSLGGRDFASLKLCPREDDYA